MEATELLWRRTPLLVAFCCGSFGCLWGMMMTGSRNLEPEAAQDGRSTTSYKQVIQSFVSPLAIENTTRKEEVWDVPFLGSGKLYWVALIVKDKLPQLDCVRIFEIQIQCDELERPEYILAMKFVIGRQRLPLHTSFEFPTGTPVPTPASLVIPVTAPASPVTSVAPNVGKPFKLILASSKRIAGWFGVTCEDCPDDSIWGCYVTKSCWKVVIVALGAIFLFIAILMAIFFLGQIDDLLKYQRQLTEYEKAYPTLARIMITPLKQFHKNFTKSYDKSMKSLTKKFGEKPWFRFLVVLPCKCLRGTWVMFQRCLQPTCLFTFTASTRIKKCISDTKFCQWAKDKALKKAGLRADPKGDKKRAIQARKEAIEAAKQAKVDGKNAKKQAKMDDKQAKSEAKAAAKVERKQARLDAKEAKKEARRAAREARNDAKLDALEDAQEAKQEALEAAEEAKQEAEEKAAEDKASKAPPTSPAPVSPPPGPPPSPIPPMAMVPPMGPPAMANQQGMYGAPAQQYVDPYRAPAQQYVDPYRAPAQQYVDPYGAQQYVDPYAVQQYAVDPYGGYGGAQGQAAYGTSGQEQFGMYGNDPMYAQQQQGANAQQAAYGQDQYAGAAPGQQAAGYGYDPNAAAQLQYPQQQQYGGQ